MVNFADSLDDNSTLYLAVNNRRTTLTAGISDAATTIPVVTTSGYPATGFVSILTGTDITQTEAIKYSGITSTTFTGASRGADGTIAKLHTSGDNVDFTIVADHHNALKDAVIALEHFVGASGSENFLGQDEYGNVIVAGDFSVLGTVTVTGGATFAQVTIADLTATSGTFSDSLTVSGTPVVIGAGAIATLQSAYDNGTGAILTTGGKPFTVEGEGETLFLQAVTVSGGDVTVSGNLGVGRTPDAGFVIDFKSNSMRLWNDAESNTAFYIDSGTAAGGDDPKISSLYFRDQGADTWSIRKNAANDFLLFDHVETKTVITAKSHADNGGLLNLQDGGVGIKKVPTESLDVVGSGTFTGDVNADGTMAADTGTFTNSLTVSGVPVSTTTYVLPDWLTVSSGTFSESLTVSGIPVATAGASAGTLQDAYDGGTGIITTTPGKPFKISGNEYDGDVDFEVVGSGKVSESLQVGSGTVFIDSLSVNAVNISAVSGTFTDKVDVQVDMTVTGTVYVGHDPTPPVYQSPIFASLDAEQTSNSTSFADVGCETAVLADGVEYLVIYSANIGNDANQTVTSALYHGAAMLSSAQGRWSVMIPPSYDNFYNGTTHNGIVRVTGNGSDTVKFTLKTGFGSVTSLIGAMGIVAVPLDRYTEDTDYFYSGTTSSAWELENPATWTTIRTETWTMDAGDYLFLFAVEGGAPNGSITGASIRYRVGGTVLGVASDWLNQGVAWCIAGTCAAHLVNIPVGGSVTVDIQGVSTRADDWADFRRSHIFAIKSGLFESITSTQDTVGFNTTNVAFDAFDALTTTVVPSVADTPYIVMATTNTYTKDANSQVTAAIRNQTDGSNYRIDGTGGTDREVGGAGTGGLYPCFLMHYEERSSTTEYRFMVKSSHGGDVTAGRDENDTGGAFSEMIIWNFTSAADAAVPISQTTIDTNLVRSHTIIADDITVRDTFDAGDITASGITASEITAPQAAFSTNLTVSGFPTATGTGFDDTITFYASSSSGGATTQLNTVTIAGGLITSWTQA